MSFRITTTVRAAVASMRGRRAFHSPFTPLGKSSLSSSPSKDDISSAYEKHYDHPSEPVYHSGLRTYVVSEPEAHSSHYHVPAGAYPTSAPYGNLDPTSAPDTASRQYSSHENTRNPSGVGERAPGVLGIRSGGYGGLSLMDKQGTTITTPGTGGLADRNSPPDGSAAEKYSKQAWKLTK